jgi:hypothetical protein
MKTQWKATCPYVDFDFSQIEDTGKTIYEGFVNYAKALEECVTDKFPTVLESAEALPDRAETAKNNASSEFDALGVMEKAKFTMAFAYNCKMLSKLPAFIKKSIAKFKEDLNALKVAKDEVQANYPQFKTHGATCSAESIKEAVPCYKKIFGPIKYT